MKRETSACAFQKVRTQNFPHASVVWEVRVSLCVFVCQHMRKRNFSRARAWCVCVCVCCLKCTVLVEIVVRGEREVCNTRTQLFKTTTVTMVKFSRGTLAPRAQEY